jgi:hypothetical protein
MIRTIRPGAPQMLLCVLWSHLLLCFFALCIFARTRSLLLRSKRVLILLLLAIGEELASVMFTSDGPSFKRYVGKRTCISRGIACQWSVCSLESKLTWLDLMLSSLCSFVPIHHKHVQDFDVTHAGSIVKRYCMMFQLPTTTGWDSFMIYTKPFCSPQALSFPSIGWHGYHC